MRLERCAPEKARPAFVALWGGAIVAAITVVAIWMRLGLPRPICRLRVWTGIPCPTCGSTRMIESLLAGDLLDAAAWNPSVFAALVVLGAWLVIRGVRVFFGLPGWRVVTTRNERRLLLVVGGLLALVGWSYLIWHGVGGPVG